MRSRPKRWRAFWARRHNRGREAQKSIEHYGKQVGQRHGLEPQSTTLQNEAALEFELVCFGKQRATVNDCEFGSVRTTPACNVRSGCWVRVHQTTVKIRDQPVAGLLWRRIRIRALFSLCHLRIFAGKVRMVNHLDTGKEQREDDH